MVRILVQTAASIVVLLAIALFTPLTGQAQEGEPYKAENLFIWLVNRVDLLAERVEALETIWEGQGAKLMPDESCALVYKSPMRSEAMILQRPTIMRYVQEFDEFPISPKLSSVRYVPDTGLIEVIYTIQRDNVYYAVEIWDGCEFQGSTKWTKAAG